MKIADWVISESGLQSLMSAGITTGWLKAWVLSAGATAVRIHLLESNRWQDSEAGWQLFFTPADELKKIAQRYDDFAHYKTTILKLDNPVRDVRCYVRENRKIVLLSLGDIAYQRHAWLAFLNDDKPLSPLYVCASDTMPMALETGLSAGFVKPADAHDRSDLNYLNATGLLIEEQVIAMLGQHNLSIRTVESCTGGAIAARLCRVPGASAVVDRAWVTYSNAAKTQEVAVDQSFIDKYGAVSQAVVTRMAEGGAGADSSYACIAVSGVAGPGGGTEKNPVGTVWIAVALPGYVTQSRCLNLSGARHDIQHQTVIAALSLLLETVDKHDRDVQILAESL